MGSEAPTPPRGCLTKPSPRWSPHGGFITKCWVARGATRPRTFQVHRENASFVFASSGSVLLLGLVAICCVMLLRLYFGDLGKQMEAAKINVASTWIQWTTWSIFLHLLLLVLKNWLRMRAEHTSPLHPGHILWVYPCGAPLQAPKKSSRSNHLP